MLPFRSHSAPPPVQGSCNRHQRLAARMLLPFQGDHAEMKLDTMVPCTTTDHPANLLCLTSCGPRTFRVKAGGSPRLDAFAPRHDRSPAKPLLYVSRQGWGLCSPRRRSPQDAASCRSIRCPPSGSASGACRPLRAPLRSCHRGTPDRRGGLRQCPRPCPRGGGGP
ncbi:hypothetical protein T484DRAFT_1935067 [Baffinella frigidus]|nr:hypothetical protein T484DRAFT_1935067 [Cryptophyta sp. CCMP2293]